MVTGRGAAFFFLAGLLFTLNACGTADDKVVDVSLELPVNWESVIDMEALGAESSTPYIGTIRFIHSGVVEEFPYGDHSASFDAGGSDDLTVQAVTAGQVIMEGSVSGLGSASGDVSVTLEKANGFSDAGSLLFPRQNHSAVSVSGVVYLLGGNSTTGVIEAVASSAGDFVSSAYAASLVYPRDKATVLHDPAGDQLFVFKGASAVDDNLYEIVDLENENSFSISLDSFRKSYVPVIFNQKVFLIAGYNQTSDWLIDSIIIQTTTLKESVGAFMSIASERYNHQCLNNGSDLTCVGGSEGINYIDDIVRIDLETEQNLVTTNLNSQKEDFSIITLTNNRILLSGGIGNTGYLKEVEIVDLNDGSSTILGSGLVKQRAKHTSVLIDVDLVLVIGGFEPKQISDTAELLNLTTGESTLLPWRMTVPRVGHTATLLSDGRVLVAGGSATDRTIEVFTPRLPQ